MDSPIFFPSPTEWRQWLTEHSADTDVVWVGFHKRGTGRPSLTWPEAVDQALCFGWIDGLRQSVDDDSYRIRFTPRKRTSIWSKRNIERVRELTELGLMQPAGIEAFEARRADRSVVYSFEQSQRRWFDQEQERLFRASESAWAFFSTRPPWYQRTAASWVVSAKREDTRARRLATLIECSEQQRTIPALTRRQP